jgi:hypothetical protein
MQAGQRGRVLSLAGAGVALIVVVAIFATLAWRGGDASVAAQDDEDGVQRTLSVNGEGRVSLAPDTVYLNLGVDIKDADLGAAQTEAAAKMEAVIAALKAAGVADADIQTSGYSIYVERDYNKSDQPIIGYHVSHTVSAKVRQMDKAGTPLEAAIEAGANAVNGVWFGLEDRDGAIKQARELAVENAREKAEDLARLTDATLGEVVSISEYSGGGTPMPYNTAYDMAMPEAAMASAPPINPGQTEVTLSVSVTWELQ